MDTNRIKRFATEARNILKAGIAAKITTLGFDKKGNVAEEHRPQLMQGGSLWNEQLQTEGFYYQWMSLYNRIQQKGISEVYEEAAYTWFNRLCAIRILQKNNLCSPVLAYADAARTPVIVDEARQGRIPQMKEELRQRLVELLDDDTKVTEQFAILITAWCHDNPIINQCFGSIADYTELLLPNNILAEGGFVDMLNHTEFITDEDFKSPELIGWLYQFYISERKDEVFAKKGKFEADEIPAATQIFTPNWIVKYMVQNTVGRIYLDNNPYETQLQKKWQYLVEPSEKPDDKALLKYNELEDLKVADLACGSGHILNECFDLLYDLYIAEGYGRGEAVEKIFSCNLTGIDLDTRAKQLATFALLLKACQKDAAFADAHCMPNVLTMPKPWNRETQGPIQDMLHIYFQGEATNGQKEEIIDCFDLMQDADSLGSIMKFAINESTRLLIKQTTDYWCSQEIVPEDVNTQIPAFKLILALTEKYHALVMNPPYMGSSKMNSILSKYVKDNYEEGKADLFSVFMQMGMKRLIFNGKMAQINMQSWMFLSSFEKLRTLLLKNYNIDNMLHLGPRTFDELSGEVVQNTAFVLSNHEPTEQGGIYYRLVDGKNCADKERLFLEAKQGNGTAIIDSKLYTINYPYVEQYNFEKIPGNPIGYWVSEIMFTIFAKNNKLAKVLTTREGMAPADNAKFLKLWYEVSKQTISLFNSNSDKWYPYIKGGTYRKWSGNQEYIVDWANNGYDIKNNIDINTGRVRSHNYNGEFAFKEAICWTVISFGKVALRYTPKGFLWDSAGASGFSSNHLFYSLALVNSVVAKSFLSVLSPSTKLNVGEVINVPFIERNKSEIDTISKNCIEFSKQDWDAHETSWDFKENELIRIFKSDAAITLEHALDFYTAEWTGKFNELHDNEEELNRKFIDIYGLQDELTPDVPLNQVTILQQKEIAIDGNNIKWNKDEIIKQLISYAMGCWMGRYRLDCPGLHIAHPNPTEEELAGYNAFGKPFEIDDDGIIPLMGEDSPFADNAVNRMKEFVAQVFGEENKAANIHFIEATLGRNMTLEKFFKKDFWKDHLRRYQKRPIYWLFQSSSRNPAFQVLVYMHRMDAYTCEKVRTYLLSYIEYLNNRIAYLESQTTTAAVTSELNTKREALKECTEYELRLHDVANQQIAFDLDDGVKANYAKFGDVLASVN